MDLCIYPSKKRFPLENKGFLAVYISRFFVDKRWKVVVDKWKVIHNKCGQPVPCGKRFSLNLWKTFPDVKKRCVFHLIVL